MHGRPENIQYECARVHSRSLTAELPAAPLQLSVHMAEVLTQKQCHEPVRKEDLRDSQSCPETPCTWCLQYVYSEGRMTSLHF